eukprot:m.310255 g.310255  ORF g.310255 m.310255 type:complete len:250 (-) comp55352_c0_seq4:149-898(-)
MSFLGKFLGGKQASAEYITDSFKESCTEIRSLETKTAAVLKGTKAVTEAIEELVRVYAKTKQMLATLEYFKNQDLRHLATYCHEAFRCFEEQTAQFKAEALQRTFETPVRRYQRVFQEIKAVIAQHEKLAQEIEKAVNKLEKTDAPKTPADAAKYDKLEKQKEAAQTAWNDSLDTVPQTIANFVDSRALVMDACFFPFIEAQIQYYRDVNSTLGQLPRQEPIDVDDHTFGAETERLLAEIQSLSITGKT